jgi:hypothetical protein
MSSTLTQQESHILSRLAYMRFQKDGIDVAGDRIGKSLKDIAKEFYVSPSEGPPKKFGGYGGLTDTEQNAMLKDIIDGKSLLSGKI